MLRSHRVLPQHESPPFSALLSLHSLNSRPGLPEASHHMRGELPGPLICIPPLLLVWMELCRVPCALGWEGWGSVLGVCHMAQSAASLPPLIQEKIHHEI